MFGEALVEEGLGSLIILVAISLVWVVSLLWVGEIPLLLLHTSTLAPGSQTVRTGFRTLGVFILWVCFDRLLIMGASAKNNQGILEYFIKILANAIFHKHHLIHFDMS